MALDFIECEEMIETPLGVRARSGPGRTHRKGIGMIEALELFGDPDRAARWMERAIWGDGPVVCPRCRGERTAPATHKTMPFRCADCRKFFSVKTGTPMGDSKLPPNHWLMAAYQDLTNLKGVSSMKLSRDLNITQSSAWYMSQRLNEAFMGDETPAEFATGKEFQVDEAYIGGLEKNKHSQDKVPGGQGGSTKMIVIGITEVASGKIWADVLTDTKGETVVDVVHRIVPKGATIYTDEGRHYGGIDRDRYAVNHGRGEYARMVDLMDGMDGMATTNQTESAWSMLKRSIVGVHHKMSPKHLRRYVKTFAGRWNIRSLDTEDQMKFVFRRMMDRPLTYATLTANNGLPSGSRKGGAYFPERRKRYRTRA